MADARDVILYEAAAVIADGEGDAVDIGALHSLLRGVFTVTVVTGTGDVRFIIETSPDGLTGWREVFDFSARGATTHEFTVDELDRYARVAWELEGPTAVSFSATAESHLLYATRRDLKLKSLSGEVLDSADSQAVAEALLSASGEAEDALNAQYSLPITTWPDSLRARCASIAKYKFFDREGFAPQGIDELIVKNYDDALSWLRAVSTRKIVLSGVAEAAIEPVRYSSGNAENPVPASKFASDFGDY